MNITYKPSKGMADSLEKYGEQFEKGKSTQIENEQLCEKLLTCPYFSEVKVTPKKKTTKSE